MSRLRSYVAVAVDVDLTGLDLLERVEVDVGACTFGFIGVWQQVSGNGRRSASGAAVQRRNGTASIPIPPPSEGIAGTARFVGLPSPPTRWKNERRGVKHQHEIARNRSLWHRYYVVGWEHALRVDICV